MNNYNLPKLNKSDEKSVALVVNYYKNIEQKQIYCIIDINYKIIEINSFTIEVFNLSGAVIGKHFLNDFERSSGRFNFVSSNLLDCVINKKIVKFLTVNKNRRVGYEMLIYEYIPLTNKTTQNVVAILISAELPSIPISFYNLKETLKQKNWECNKINENLVLSEREKEILFLVFHCRSRDEIAEILSRLHGKLITEDAVRKIIQRNLYSKFNAVNDSELRKFIRNSKFYLRIPDVISDEFMFKVEELWAVEI